MKKILVINPFGIGDVLFTTPLLRKLRDNIPGVFIGYAANRRTAPLLENNPLVDKVFIYERDEFKAVYQSSKQKFFRRFFDFLKDVKQEGFDAALDLSLSSPMSFLLWLLGVKKRIGFNYKNRSPWLTTKIILKGYEDRHVVEYYQSLLSCLGIPGGAASLTLPVHPPDRRFAGEWLAEQNLCQHKPRIGFVPGGGASWGKESRYKRWPAEKYAKLADKLIEKFNAAIILMGDEKEKDVCSEVSRLMQGRAFLLCGATTLGQFGALAAVMDVMVVNDGGPLHMAVAAGSRSVSIFGPVDEKVYGPYAPGYGDHAVVTADVACRPCYRRFRMTDCKHLSCLERIGVEDVLRKVERFLKRDVPV